MVDLGYITVDTEELKAGHLYVLQHCKMKHRNNQSGKHTNNNSNNKKPQKNKTLKYTFHGINNYIGETSTSLKKGTLFSIC